MQKESLRRYLEHGNDAGMREELRKWLLDHDSEEIRTAAQSGDFVEEVLQAFWQESLQNVAPAEMTEKRYRALTDRIFGQKRKRFAPNRILRWVAQSAAVLLLVVCVYGYAVRQIPPQPEWVEVYAPHGQTREITLPDGSRIWLNAGTYLFYPERFDRERRLFVSGEIYLDVKNALPGKFPIEFTKGKQKISYKYELKGRQARASEKEGFNSSDVIYLMMPDRFANGDMGNDKVEMKYPYTVDRSNVSARHGGDLAGVKRHIDYLTELGVTALWMTPVLENDMGEGSYHGYAATDYYKIDPRFGTNEEYVDLVKSLHDKGIKVIMDMVFNHCGSRHPWMNDQPTADWFNNPDSYVQTNHNKTVFFDPYASDIDRKEMTDGWFVPTMPDLNQRNPHLAKYLIQNSIWWVEYADLNGIRQDTYPYPDSDMMKRWCNALYAEYPDINIVGEAMITNPFGAAFWQKNSRLNFNGNTDLKSVMDFHLSSVASKAFHEETYWAGGLQTIFEHFVCDFAYPDIKNVMRLLDNHDMDRFLVEEPKDLNAFKQATTLLLTVPGIPQLYYGHELAFYGSSKVDYGYIRPDMPGGWMGDSLNVFEEQGRTAIQREAFKFTKNLLNWRKGNKVISEGTMKHFVPRNGVYVYARSYEGKTVVVVINGMKSEVELPLAPYAEVLGKAEKAYDVLTGRHIALQNKLMLAPKAVLLLEL